MKTHRYLAALISIIIAIVCIAGCGGSNNGGGGGGNNGGNNTGGNNTGGNNTGGNNTGGNNTGGETPAPAPTRATLRVRIDFPTGSRFVPVSAQCVKVSVKQGENELQQAIVVKPAGGGVQEQIFNDLPAVPLTVVTTAYANANASGTPVAEGVQTVTNNGGNVATVDIAMNSTVQSVVVTSSSSEISIGDVTSIAAVARNASNQDVLTDPSKWRWSSSNPSIATVESAGATATVRGVSVGEVDITATESETGKAGVFHVKALRPAPTLLFRDGGSIYWYNARKADAAIKTTTLGGSPVYPRMTLMPNGAIGVNVANSGSSVVAVVDRNTALVGPNSSTINYGSYGIDSLFGLPDGKILAHTTLGFAVINPSTGVVESTGGLRIYGRIFDIVRGPDNKIYLLSSSRTGQSSGYVLARLNLGANDILTEEVILFKQAAKFSSMQFLSNGSLAIAEPDSGTIRLYSVGANNVTPLGSAVSVKGIRTIRIYRNVSVEGDEILYALTASGVRRFSFSNGTLNPLDTEAAPFLSKSSGDDIAVAN